MKKILICLLFVMVVAGGLTVYGGGAASSSQSETAPEDSLVNVIAWFNKHDSVTYMVTETSWKFNGNDTVLKAGSQMKVLINVVDSTAEGYKMEYTFLDFPSVAVPDSASAVAKFQNQIIAKFADKIIGTTVRFETDIYGKITKYNNLGQIKRQAKSLFKDAMKELSRLPEMKVLKALGLNINDLTKKIDTDQLVDGYLEELNMLFNYHGNAFRIGEFTGNNEATDTEPENTAFLSVEIDSEDGSYQILSDIVSVIPRSELKKLLGGILESVSDKTITESFNENFDKQVGEDGSKDVLFRIDYLSNGWPYFAVLQKTTDISGRGEIRQLQINIDSYHFAH